MWKEKNSLGFGRFCQRGFIETMFQKKKKLNGLEVDKWRPVFFVVVVPEALMSYCRYAQH